MTAEEFAEFQIEAYRQALDLGFKISVYPTATLGSCTAVSTSAVIIEPSGMVHNCWKTIGLEGQETGELGSAGVVYNGNRLKWIGWSPFSKKCLDCDVLPLCMGGCPYESIYGDGMSNGEADHCALWKYNLPRMLDLCYEAYSRGLLPAAKALGPSACVTARGAP
jgi:uncharacterized protein